MALINLMALQPHKVSRDLSGYIIYVYGEGKTGKTTFASQLPGSLILAFEKGYNALAGIMVQDITTWGELKQVLRELRKDEVKGTFKSIAIDTVDIAGGLCEKYVCAQAGVEKLGDIPYGQGWTLVKKEFEETFRAMTQLGYAVVFISHTKDKVFKRKDGSEYNQTIPSCPTSYNEIAKNMADIYAFAEKYTVEGIAKVRLVFRSPDNSADTGSRFKYIQPILDDFSYQGVVDAISKAIDKEAEMLGKADLFTEERETYTNAPVFDYEGLKAEFGELVKDLMNQNPQYYQPRITAIIDKYLGKGKKVNEATIEQAELIHLINTEIKEDLVMTKDTAPLKG